MDITTELILTIGMELILAIDSIRMFAIVMTIIRISTRSYIFGLPLKNDAGYNCCE